MQFIFDHLTALIISSTVILIIVVMQVRGSFSMIETHVAESVQNEMQDLHEILEWELSMMPTQDYTNNVAIPDGRFLGPGTFRCEFTQTGNNTTQFIFPTFDKEFGIADSLQPPVDSMDVIEVRYDLVALNDSISVSTGATDIFLPIYRLERYVNGGFSGDLNEVLTDFQIQHIALNGGPNGYTSITGNCPSTMRKIRYNYRMVTQGIDFITNDQRSSGQLNQGQFGMTVDLINWKSSF